MVGGGGDLFGVEASSMADRDTVVGTEALVVQYLGLSLLLLKRKCVGGKELRTVKYWDLNQWRVHWVWP